MVRAIRDRYKDLEVLVVDDGSSDKTSLVALRAGAHVIRLLENRGQMYAFRIGFSYCLEKGYETLITMDADGQHDPSDIARLLEALTKHGSDVVIGSRMMPGGSTGTMPIYRRLGIRFFTKLTNLLLRQRLTDVMSGFRAYRGTFLKSLIA